MKPREDYGHVPQTFEEFAGQHIDGLYHGALFLNAGEEAAAEDLVVWTLTGGFQEFRKVEKGGEWDRWIERKLVEAFLAREGSRSPDEGSVYAFSNEDSTTDDDPTKDSIHEPSTGVVEIDHEVLLRSAANMPPVARAAIWLVLFRRWPYLETSKVLKTDVDGLKGLLRYRHVLLAAVVRGPVDRNGTDQDLSTRRWKA